MKYNKIKETPPCFRVKPPPFSVGLPGLEPGKTGPESVVLPLHHSPIQILSKLGYQDSNLEKQDQNLLCYHYTIAQFRISTAKVATFFEPANFYLLFSLSKIIPASPTACGRCTSVANCDNRPYYLKKIKSGLFWAQKLK